MDKAMKQILTELAELELLPETAGNLMYAQGLERALQILTDIRKGN